MGLARWVLVAAICVSCGLACRAEPRPLVDPALGDFRGIGPLSVDAKFVREWNALQRKRAQNPADPEITRRANTILRRKPAAPLRAAVSLAKAEQRYWVGDDTGAVEAVDRVFARSVENRGAVAVDVALAIVRVRALVRSGDPRRALDLLARDPRLADQALSESERLGLHAVGLDRAEDTAVAAVAFARWRSVLDAGTAAARYAETRFAVLSREISPDILARQRDTVADAAVRQCLDARLGRPAVEAPVPAWVRRCGGPPRRIGVLLPRTGSLSAFADPHLAAISVSMDILGIVGSDAGGYVRWADAGSSTTDAVQGARALRAAGVDVVVGPVGAASIRAVAQTLAADGTKMVVPGESVGDVKGVAPVLEARIGALIAYARAHGASQLVVVAPENGYGRRAAEAAQRWTRGHAGWVTQVKMYPPETTSFSPLLSPVLGRLRPGAAVLIPDLLARVELIVRQLARFGITSGDDGPLLLTTGEGLGAASLGRGHEVLEGVRMVPAANRTPASAIFERAYIARQGKRPGDQALLVYYAFRSAWLGEAQPPISTVFRVQDGDLVAETETRHRG